MEQEANSVQCPNHGPQPQAFLCRHLVETIDSGEAVGFHWPSESTNPTPDAWCNSCEEARDAAGGEWTEEILKQVDVSVVCAGCYQLAKNVWLRERSKAGLNAL